jgi:hypothetical protein
MAYPSPFGPQLGSNQFGAGSLSAGTSGLISASGGLGNTRGTPSGRSSFDLGRMSEQAIRDMRRKGNFAGAFGIGANMATLGMRMSEAQQEQAGMSALQNAYQRQIGGQGQPAQAQPMAFGATNQAGWGNVGGDTGTREGNIEAAKKSGNFEAIVNRYNQMAQGSGKMMDAQGNIVPVGQAQPPAQAQAPAAGNGSFTIPSANTGDQFASMASPDVGRIVNSTYNPFKK